MYSTIKNGKKSGIYYIDGTCLPVCHLKRSKRHKVGVLKSKRGFGKMRRK